MSARRRIWILLISVVLLSILLRIGVAIYLGNGFSDIRGGTYDQISYDALAQRLIGGYGFSFEKEWWPYARIEQPTAFWSYLYTLYLAGIYATVGHQPIVARLIQAVLVGVLMPVLLFRIGRRHFNEWVGLIAAFITAVYLYFATYASSLMTEAFYIVGILWIFDITGRITKEIAAEIKPTKVFLLGLELGLALGITLLLRQVIMFFYLVLALWLVWAGWLQHRLSQVFALWMVAGTVIFMLVLPWMWRNYQVFDALALPNTNAGFVFFWANHPIYGTRFEAVLSPEHGVTYQELIPPDLRDLNEAALDRALLDRGLQFVQDDPQRYILLSFSRIPVYFLFWPTNESSFLSNTARILSFGLFLPFMLAGLFLAARKAWSKRRDDQTRLIDLTIDFRFLLVLFVVVYAGIHLVSWANVRYRLPVDAVLILFAAYAIERMLLMYCNRKESKEVLLAVQELHLNRGGEIDGI